jgi:hypothetical protein
MRLPGEKLMEKYHLFFTASATTYPSSLAGAESFVARKLTFYFAA